MLYRYIMKPIFFAMHPERAHNVMIKGMSIGQHVPGMKALMRALYGVKKTDELSASHWGIDFHHPIGMAAGLDEDAKGIAMFSSIGFGFIEVGTVTPRPQIGNPKPRVFRLPEYKALINRMGFNNQGIAQMVKNIEKVKHKPIPIAINIGKNKDTPNEQAAADYEACIRELYAHGDFFVVNISSPNTPDLRKLQHGDDLTQLLQVVMNEMKVQKQKYRQAESQADHRADRHADRQAEHRADHQADQQARKPVLVKVAPDLEDEELERIVNTIMQSGVDGIIATNTTLSRAGLEHKHAGEAGGLSGHPLKDRSTEVIKKIYRLTEGKLPIIGTGGVFTSEDAYEKIRAGASLVEVYTGLIYEGPKINKKLNEGLLALLKRDGFTHISQAVGIDA